MNKIELFKLASSISPCIYNGRKVNIHVNDANKFIYDYVLTHNCENYHYIYCWVKRICSFIE